MGITASLTDYIINADFERLPKEAVTKTKDFILDEIGNALGGTALRSGKTIIEWGKHLGGAAEATLFSDGTRVPVGIASGVNTQLCMGLELMETYKNRGHPGSGMVTTALAFAERDRLGGKDILTAICTAYDVTGRIIDATFPSPEYRRKVWNSSWQGCGPLIVAIKLLGLTREQAMHAFGMGLGNAPTMNVHNILFVPGSMSKVGNQFHSFVAVNAAVLAKMGYTGYHEILDEPFAYWTTISDANDGGAYIQGLGEDFLVLSALAFKPWPTCRWAQGGIQSLLTIMGENSLKPDDIELVTYHAHEKVTGYPFDNTNPSRAEDAYWSVPWAFGNASLGHPIGPSWYVDERFTDENLKRFMGKVKIKTLPEAVEAFSSEPEKSVTLLEVRTTNGSVYTRATEYCKGDPQEPMRHQEVIDKFLSQTSGVVSLQKAQRIISLVERLEDVSDASEIAHLVY
ncbi:MAG: MmgE/PrpD family protein [Deltaproteobacteria bacterium]|nr:MmgE/PrpD family protein [Deltaproteobacteria bacterium]